ncbi:cytosolic protein [Thalassobacillus hwangdonensis]|uniref:Cytosolic protein n=1 Tax=Thalassobacillus hwangdonensis TaxID=546108 RepID=A0ABW3L0W3_9BACI
MKLKKFINRNLTNQSETREHHEDAALQTHYFKTTKQKAYKAAEAVFQREGYTILSSSEERGEISVNFKGKKKAFIVTSIVMVKPFRTAIDFNVTTESGGPFDFGFSRRTIIDIYTELKKNLPYIETSMADRISE